MNRGQILPMASAAALTLGLLAGPALAGPDEPASDSEATITLDGCVVESSKDISYIAYVDDGTQVDKDESVEASSFDLTTVEGIEEIDAVEVKSGTTVESFEIDCGDATSSGDGEVDGGETAEPDEPEGDDTTEPDEGTDEGDEETREGSEATITLDGCVVESSKDISYIAYVDDGTQVDKDESVEASSFDLTTVEGIEEIDAVEVKSGTTVESFEIDCGDATSSGDGEVDGGETAEPDEPEGDDTTEPDEGTDEGDEETREGSEATITLDGCVVESSKDISYIAYVDDGTQVDKDESVQASSFDLTTVEGIEEIDAVEVKSGTTVESFDIDCVSS